jgi:hypothetical protein
MLIDIVKLPPPIGLPIDTRIPLITDEKIPTDLLGSNFLYWPDIVTDQPPLIVGNKIDTKIPYNLYKSTHISDTDEWVFETVFNVNHNETTVLYTKMISKAKALVGISPSATTKFSDSPTPISSLTNFIGEESWLGNRSKAEVIIVPPIFGEDALHHYISNLARDYLRGYSHWKFTSQYKPLFDDCISVFSSFYEEKYIRSPFHEVMGYHPSVNCNLILQNRWYMYENLNYYSQARELVFRTNDVYYADWVIKLYNLQFNVLDLECSVGIDNNYINPEITYIDYLDFYKDFFTDSSSRILHIYHLIDEFVRLFIGRKTTMGRPKHLKLHIQKNSLEEISIRVKTDLSDIEICFYYSIPLLMLSTMSVGWYM